jgi:hypothetical protein
MSRAAGPRPGKQRSLWDIMINFQAFGLAHLLQMLVLETGNIAARQQILRMSSQPLPGAPVYEFNLESDEAQRLEGLFNYALYVGNWKLTLAWIGLSGF